MQIFSSVKKIGKSLKKLEWQIEVQGFKVKCTLQRIAKTSIFKN